jgi:outer membrane lipoprotein-sorting protein
VLDEGPASRPDWCEDGGLLFLRTSAGTPEFGTITIGFATKPGAPGGLTLAGWQVLDAQGNRTTTVLSNQQFGGAISDKAFLWSDPRPKNRGH